MADWILHIETATELCSAALSRDGEAIYVREEEGSNLHASRLTVLIDELLKEANIKIGDLAAVSVSEGPGSYTGLRIGASMAKGLAYALDVPLIAVTTLKILAQAALSEMHPTPDTLLCPMLDARRMEVYTALYNAHLTELAATSSKVLDENSFQAELTIRPILFLGNGATKARTVISHPNASFAENIKPSARYQAQLAWDAFMERNFADVFTFTPFYLKETRITESKKKLL
jgi:tRNA threonylcarbamoyladenosine biosynthesis protein TsaB